MNEIYVLLIGFGLLIIGIYRFTRQYLTLKKGDIVFAEVVRCKNKSGSKGKRYCYPYVAVTSNTGTVREFYCYAAKRSGHDYYHAGEELELYLYKSMVSPTIYIFESFLFNFGNDLQMTSPFFSIILIFG